MLIHLVGYALCLIAVGWTVWNTVDLAPRRTVGQVLQDVPIPILARMKMLLPAAAIMSLVETPALILHAVHWAFAPVSLLLLLAILAIPVRLVITSVGIRPGWKGFHRWTEFAGVRRSRRGVMLQHVGGRRGITLWLIGARDEDEMIHLIRTLIREAYTGRRNANASD